MIQIQLAAPAASPAITPSLLQAHGLSAPWMHQALYHPRVFTLILSHHFGLSSKDTTLEKSPQTPLSNITAKSRIIKKSPSST